jgi:hypothetical protein
MTATMVFAVVGNEITVAQGVPNKPGQIGYGAAIVPVNQGTGVAGTVSPFRIIFGGTIATSLLILVSHAGEAGETLGTGLAVVAFTTAALVYGGPVWNAVNKAFGSKPTKPLAGTTPSSPSTTPTATAAALVQVTPFG